MRGHVQAWRGDAALYTPAEGGAAVECTAVERMIEMPVTVDGFTMLQTARVVILLTAEIASRPTRGATVEMLDADGAVVKTYTIAEDAVSPDSATLEWRCRVGEPGA